MIYYINYLNYFGKIVLDFYGTWKYNFIKNVFIFFFYNKFQNYYKYILKKNINWRIYKNIFIIFFINIYTMYYKKKFLIILLKE